MPENISIRLVLIFFQFLLFTGGIFGQTLDLTLSLVDDSSGEPVEFAFVFLENTTIGGTTDESGLIEFKGERIEEHTIVITHLLYEEVKLKGSAITSELLVVRLKQKAYDLDEVTVKTKRTKSRNYKKWMKRFEEAFIGSRRVRKKVKILNPEVIWFEENRDTLIAHAVNNIQLRNELTGYVMHVALSEFSLSDQGDITYSGSIYFDDIIDELKKSETIERRRREYFRNSRQLFFKSLFWKHPVNTEEYTIGVTREKEDSGLVYTESDMEQLRWNRGISADTLAVDGYLTVIVKDKIREAWRLGSTKYSTVDAQKQSASFLLSKTGKFVVNKNGYVLNQADIEESGYWTNVRMAHELPINYLGNVIFQEEESIAILDELQSYKSKYNPEKIYVHTDKSAYLPFEHLWFKAYLVNAVDHSVDTPSEVVYVDLVNEKGEVVNNWLLNSKLGLTGDMKWTSTFNTGTYLLRAYTNHMRNQGEQYFFEKELVLSSLNNSLAKDDSAVGLAQVSFFPEGGDLVEAVTSQVAFVSVDSSGQPIDIAGVIKDNDGNVITTCQSMHRGIGMFQLVPSESKTYFLETSVEGDEMRFNLPPVQASGIGMQINATEANNIYIDILSDSKISKDAFLIGHMRGEVFTFVNDLSTDKSLTISKSSIPPGVVHFTLFDQYERPQAERLVFNDRGYEKNVINSENINLTDEEHSMTFTIDSLYLENAINLSMSIVDEVHYPSALVEQNISSYLHLNSDLEQHIQGLNAYLVGIDNTKRFYLDLILRTQVWRRFTWKDLKSKKDNEFAIETGYALHGLVTEVDNGSPLQSRVMITALGPEPHYEQMNSSSDGTFSYENLKANDSITYIIQARKGKFIPGEKESFELEGDRLVDITASAKMGLPFTKSKTVLSNLQKKDDFEEEALEELTTTYAALQRVDSTIWQIQSEEILIEGRRGNHTTNRPTRSSLTYLDRADWIHPATSGVALISAVSPRRTFYYGPEGKLYARVINAYGETISIPSQVIIDGFGDEMGGSTSTPHRLRTLPADMIESIFVGDGLVVVTTRTIPRSVEKSLDSGIIHIDHPGYYKAREFADLTSDTPSKLVSTVFWDPNVSFDEKGNLEISIKEDLQKSSYVVVLEGVSAQGDIISFRKRYGE